MSVTEIPTGYFTALAIASDRCPRGERYHLVVEAADGEIEVADVRGHGSRRAENMAKLSLNSAEARWLAARLLEASDVADAQEARSVAELAARAERGPA